MLDSSKLLSLILQMLNQQAPVVPTAKSSHPSDIRETAEEVIVALEVPGIQSRDDVFFSVGVTKLTVKGFRQRMSGIRPNSDIEISREKFENTFHLPYPVRPETATAFYSKGILEIKLKKLPEKTWDKVFLQFL